METTQLIAVDQVLVSTSDDIDADFVNSYLTTMVFANAAARAETKVLQTPEDCTKFYEKWVSTLGTVGWILTSAGGSQVVTRSLGKTTTIVTELTNTVGSQSSKIFASLGQDDRKLTTEVESLLKFWWDSAKTTATFACLTIGILSEVTDSAEKKPKCDLAVFFIDMSKVTRPKPSFLLPAPAFDADTWQSLFVTVNDDLVLLPTKSITGLLNPQRYSEKEAQIKAMLQSKAPEHYRLAALSVS